MINLAQLAILSGRSQEQVRCDIRDGKIFPVVTTWCATEPYKVKERLISEQVAFRYIRQHLRPLPKIPKICKSPRRDAILKYVDAGWDYNGIAKYFKIKKDTVVQTVYRWRKLQKTIQELGGRVDVVPNSELATSTQHKHPVRMAES